MSDLFKEQFECEIDLFNSKNKLIDWLDDEINIQPEFLEAELLFNYRKLSLNLGG